MLFNRFNRFGRARVRRVEGVVRRGLGELNHNGFGE